MKRNDVKIKCLNISMTTVYVDGSCINNGKPNAVAGWAVFYGDDDPRNMSASLDGDQTNNRAEITACVKAIEHFVGDHIHICTDSKYTIQCVTTWIKTWKKNSWKTANKKPVKNADLIMRLDQLVTLSPFIVTFEHVYGHDKKPSQSPERTYGNMCADEMAQAVLKKRF